MIEINNFTDFSLDKKFLEKVAKNVLKGENKEIESLSIAFIKPDEIRKINKEYRKHDNPTDVLSFEVDSDIKYDQGEIIICPEVVLENSKEIGLDFKNELLRVLIHGILHSLGYDHEISKKEEKRMFGKEDYYLSTISKNFKK